jgi:hypothetical protein
VNEVHGPGLIDLTSIGPTLAQRPIPLHLRSGAAGGWASEVFGSGSTAPAVDVKSLHAKIGELTLENDF